MLCTQYPPRAAARRPAFTLIELLVIIAILATLLALTAGAILRFMTVQQQNNTKTLLNRVDTQLQKRISDIKDQAMRESIPTATQDFIWQSLAGNDPNYKDRTRVIYVKLKVRQMFPETFDEVFNPQVPGMYMASYAAYLNKYGITAQNSVGNGITSAAGQYQYQSAVCLAMALQAGSGGLNMDDLGKGGSLGTVPVDPTASSASAPALIDAWGTPICFSRFPAGSTVRNAQGPMSGANDPLDPLGLLNNGSWPAPNQIYYQSLLLQRLTGQANTSFNLAPLVVSAGPDRKFDLWMSPGPGPAGSSYGYFDFSPVGNGANDNLYPGS